VILAAAFETMQAELRSGLDDDDLSPNSRAILLHIEESSFASHFERGSSRYTDLVAVADHELASLAQRLDEEAFHMTNAVQSSQIGSVEWLDESTEFSG
jgi:hypothetical protein